MKGQKTIMKLNVFNRKKTVLEKLTSTYDVKLDASASQLIMDVLAKLYDNPVEAAIREYVSNAYDANVEAGSTEPVHLHVPTEDEPYLEVSDTGNGLDYLGIVSIFANFGTSTKRDSNEFNIFGKYVFAFCDSAALYWHINSDTNSVIKIEDILQYMPGENNNAAQNYNDALVQHSTVFDMNHQPWVSLELADIPDNPQTHIICSNTSNCLDDVYDFVLPSNNDNVIIATTYTDGIDWILRNKPNITYFSKSNMDAYAQDIRTIIEPVLVNDNAVYLLRTIIKNKQLSSNISMLNLDTKQDTETYLAALHKATRRVEPKTHNLSFDQKVFLAALVSRDRKFLSKKDAHKIIKRLKLLFPDELKLIKDCADEIVNKVQL